MAQELVNIEVDGAQLQAAKGSMLIEATDRAGLSIKLNEVSALARRLCSCGLC